MIAIEKKTLSMMHGQQIFVSLTTTILAFVCLSVCPSMCMSVTRRYCIKTAARVELFLVAPLARCEARLE